MRLIDELLKDDFFHGGYHPPVPDASAKAAQGSSAVAGKKPIVLIAAAVGGLALFGAGGFFFFTSGKKAAPAAQTAPATTTAAVATKAPAAAPAASVPVVPAVAENPVAAAPEAPAAVAPAPVAVAPVAVAKVAPAPVVEAKPAAPDLFTLVFPKFSEKEKAQAVVDKLKAAGASPKLVTGSDKVTAYRVKSAKNATAAESNAIKLKASIFKVSTTPNPQADGSVVFDFGVFATKAEAEAVVGNAKKLSHEVAISPEKTSTPVYSIDAGKWPEEEARAKLSALAEDGDGVKVKKVK